MKCFRIREDSRVCFLMESRVERIDKNYSSAIGRLSLKFYLKEGGERGFDLRMDVEAFALFELRWERFQTSDEIFFDFGEFQ
jgi:hypothetical protein